MANIILFLIFLTIFENTFAFCIKSRTSLGPKLSAIPNIYQTNILWERVANKSMFQKDLKVHQVVLVPYKLEELAYFDYFRNLVPNSLKSHMEKIFDGKTVKFPIHPSFTLRAPQMFSSVADSYDSVPWVKKGLNLEIKLKAEKKKLDKLPVILTASRSLYSYPSNDFPGFGIKVGTSSLSSRNLKNQPKRSINFDNPQLDFQPTKLLLGKEIPISRDRTHMLLKVDSMIGLDDQLEVAKEFFFASVKTTYQQEEYSAKKPFFIERGEFSDNKIYADKTNGFLLRDISYLGDGYYYLPGFSVFNKVGIDIALKFKNEAKDTKISDKDWYLEFWGKHFAYALGKAKAKMLLRYGLQFVTPNSQNFLFQLDQNQRPTGRIIFRDLPDSHYLKIFAPEYVKEYIVKDENRGSRFPQYLDANLTNSLFHSAKSQLEGWFLTGKIEENEYSLSDGLHNLDLFKKWLPIHAQGYSDEVKEFLGISEIPSSTQTVDDYFQKVKDTKLESMGMREEMRTYKDIHNYLLGAGASILKARRKALLEGCGF